MFYKRRLSNGSLLRYVTCEPSVKPRVILAYRSSLRYVRLSVDGCTMNSKLLVFWLMPQLVTSSSPEYCVTDWKTEQKVDFNKDKVELIETTLSTKLPFHTILSREVVFDWNDKDKALYEIISAVIPGEDTLYFKSYKDSTMKNMIEKWTRAQYLATKSFKDCDKLHLDDL